MRRTARTLFDGRPDRPPFVHHRLQLPPALLERADKRPHLPLEDDDLALPAVQRKVGRLVPVRVVYEAREVIGGGLERGVKLVHWMWRRMRRRGQGRCGWDVGCGGGGGEEGE